MTSLSVDINTMQRASASSTGLETDTLPAKYRLLFRGNFVSCFSDRDTKDFGICPFLEAAVTKLTMLVCCRGL